MTNDQCSVTNERPIRRRIGYWLLVIGHCVLLAACSGGNNAPEIAGLAGERKGPDLSSVAPAADLGPAPTETHGRLAALLPREALVKDSVVYTDWDQKSALPAGDGAKAVLPTVQAVYRSMGYRVVLDDPKAPKGKSRTDVEYPQEATLILVRAPEAQAAEIVAERLRKHFTDKGFAAEAPMLVGDGKTVGGLKIERFMRIDSGTDADNVFVAYLQVMGGTVVYAIESETPPPIKTGEGTQAKRVLSGQLGTRLGAQLITLVGARANP